MVSHRGFFFRLALPLTTAPNMELALFLNFPKVCRFRGCHKTDLDFGSHSGCHSCLQFPLSEPLPPSLSTTASSTKNAVCVFFLHLICQFPTSEHNSAGQEDTNGQREPVNTTFMAITSRSRITGNSPVALSFELHSPVIFAGFRRLPLLEMCGGKGPPFSTLGPSTALTRWVSMRFRLYKN